MARPDIISTLPDEVLILIISFLSFKDCLKTSVLKKRWRNLCYQTKNIAFKEAEYVDRSVLDDELTRRFSFVHYMLQWCSRFPNHDIESFEIYLPTPVGFVDYIHSLIELAASRGVKKLVLDFTDPSWTPISKLLFPLPECVYSLTTLESLTLYACRFDPSRFSNQGRLRTLSLGWVILFNLQSLLSKSPLLEYLSVRYCWVFDITRIAGPMREVVFENCSLAYSRTCSLNLPNLYIFKYTGYAPRLYFESMNMGVKEVCLDFRLECEYHVPTDSNQVDGKFTCCYLNHLRSATTLTVCPYILQAIQESENSVLSLRPMKTRNLVLRTRLHPKEFTGIRMLLKNRPDLETLTFDMLPPSLFLTCSTYRGIDPQTYWLENITYKCLRKTLKVVVVMNFFGGLNEVNVLSYLIGTGFVLRRIDLYALEMLEEHEKMLARAGAEMLQRTSKGVHVLLHNA